MPPRHYTKPVYDNHFQESDGEVAPAPISSFHCLNRRHRLNLQFNLYIEQRRL